MTSFQQQWLRTGGPVRAGFICINRRMAALVLSCWILAGCHPIPTAAPSQGLLPDASQADPGLTEYPVVGKPRPSAASSFVLQARRQYKAGQLEAARSSLRKARKIDPLISTAWELEADIAFDQGLGDDAVFALRALLAANPMSARVHHRTGDRLMKHDRMDEGIDALERAVELSPREEDYLRSLAAAYAESGQIASAINILRRGLTLDSGHRHFAGLLGRLQEQSGDWSDAVESYSLALNATPDQTTYRRHRARCLYQLNRWEESQADYEACFFERETSLTLADQVFYGDCCLRTNNTRTARKLVEDLSKRFSWQMLEIEILRIICALKEDDYSTAQDLFARASAEWPADSMLNRLQAMCHPPALPVVVVPGKSKTQSSIAVESPIELVSLQQTDDPKTEDWMEDLIRDIPSIVPSRQVGVPPIFALEFSAESSNRDSD